MAGFDPQLVVGGGQPTLTQAPSAGSGMGRNPLANANVQAHHGLIGLVLVAVLVLFLLDRAGFRFAVTVGKR